MNGSAYLAAVLCAISGTLRVPAATPAPGPEAANVMLPARDTVLRFVGVDAVDFSTLPAPPVDGSLAAAADLETVLQVQAMRTPGQIAWAKTVDKDSVFLNREVLGDWFTRDRLPVTAAFFTALADDLKATDARAKAPFKRARPYEVDTRVQPCVPRPSSSSYPSGSALQAFVWAELLAEMVPAKREALFDRAHRAAWGRVIGGVHFPSDLIAGRRLAGPFLAACRRSESFRRQFAAAREEVLAAMKRGA